MTIKEHLAAKSASGLPYESPEITVIGLSSEGVLCASGDEDLWYKKGGEGDFVYDTTTDDIWG